MKTAIIAILAAFATYSAAAQTCDSECWEARRLELIEKEAEKQQKEWENEEKAERQRQKDKADTIKKIDSIAIEPKGTTTIAK